MRPRLAAAAATTAAAATPVVHFVLSGQPIGDRLLALFAVAMLIKLCPNERRCERDPNGSATQGGRFFLFVNWRARGPRARAMMKNETSEWQDGVESDQKLGETRAEGRAFA